MRVIEDVYWDMYTVAEVRQLVKFYRTPFGRKMLNDGARIMGGLQNKMLELFEELVADVMEDLE